MQRHKKGGLSTSLSWDLQQRARGGDGGWAVEGRVPAAPVLLSARC